MRYQVKRRNVQRRARNTRIAQRRLRPTNVALLLWLFLGSAFVSCAVAFALQTPALLVREVTIRGVHLADRAAVERAAKPALGKNIILLHKAAITAGIRRLSEVAEVRVGRSLPHRVWVQVIERKPDAILECGGACCYVQYDGTAFHAAEGWKRGIAYIRIANCPPVKIGTRSSRPAVRLALDVLKQTRENRLKISKISIDPLGDICLNMESGFYVKLGQPEEMTKKLGLLRCALRCKPSLVREAAYIDLSCPSAPVWKPKSVAQAAS